MINVIFNYLARVVMPYSQDHKEKSRQRILASAYKLFSANGYNNISINQIMADADMTRGAFYAHFDNKSVLYREAIFFAAQNSKILRTKPDGLEVKEWLHNLVRSYLDKMNFTKNHPCPLASLVTDVSVRENDVRNAYTSVFKGLNDLISKYTKTYSNCDSGTVLAISAMMIGGAAIARAIDDPELVEKLLENCRVEALRLLDGDSFS